ncbi:hypothetical protein [Vibrio crassostreae]|uniref:hypothetical protein n=1 Tax=Vibrio crassostreae TaxID=246167 RepID=UPI001B3108B9|nr:hypothetical protein [Vibrio crassostreae]
MKKTTIALLGLVGATASSSALADYTEYVPLVFDNPAYSYPIQPVGTAKEQYWFEPSTLNFNADFSDVRQVCFLSSGEFINEPNREYTWASVRVTGSMDTIDLALTNGLEYCTSMSKMALEAEKDGIIPIELSINNTSPVRWDYIKARILYFGQYDKHEPETPPLSCSDGLVFVDATENSISPANGTHAYVECELEPNITYEMKVVKVDEANGVHNTDTTAKFENVAATFVKPTGEKRIDTINNYEKTYITTDGSVKFFYSDENDNNFSGNYVEFKRVNLD